MNSFGKVTQIKGKFVIISTARNSGCGDCNSCSHGADTTMTSISALNTVEARIGDTVEYEMPTSSILKAAFIAYTIPLIVMVLAIFISTKVLPMMNIIDNVEMYSALIGILSLAVVFGILKISDKKLSKNSNFIAKTTRIILRKEQEVF
jgi:sigma-E factor negative regulatory protein RseC